MNQSAIRNALIKGKNKNYKVLELENLNHMFQQCETGDIKEYKNIPDKFFYMNGVENVVLISLLDRILNFSGGVKISLLGEGYPSVRIKYFKLIRDLILHDKIYLLKKIWRTVRNSPDFISQAGWSARTIGDHSEQPEHRSREETLPELPQREGLHLPEEGVCIRRLSSPLGPNLPSNLISSWCTA